MHEEWKEIEGTDGMYLISNKGRIMNAKRQHINVEHINNRGYIQYLIKQYGKMTWKLAHRIVAQHFIPNPNNYPEVNHKDENKTNNNVENLEWCTRSYNNTYNNAHIRRVISQGHKIYQYDKQGNLIAEYVSQSEAARRIGVKQQCINNCCNGKAKTTKGFIISTAKI